MDRKSETHSRFRRTAALAVTSIAAITLLIGPDATLGLDVPTAGGVVSGTTQVTQNVSSTVQQTTQQVSATVGTTTQPVVQTTQQVSAPVQQTAAPVTAAPTAPAAAAPVRTATPTKAAVVRHLAAQAPTLAAKAGGASHAARAVATTTTAVTQRATRSARVARRDHAVRQPGRPATATPASPGSCDAATLLGPIAPLLSALGQESLAGVICDATAVIAPAAASSTTALPTGSNDGLVGVLAAVPAHLKLLGMLVNGHAAAVGVHGVAAGADQANRATTQRGRGATPSYSSPGTASPATGASLVAANAAAATQQAEQQNSRHGGLFGSSVTGTEAIFALLAADWALLAGIATWKLARRRRFVPSFS